MAVDMFLKLDGIDGESKDSFFKDWIEIESFSWGATNTGAHSTGGGGGAGKVSMNDLSFSAVVNKSSPLLMKSCATGQHIKQATLSVRKGKGGGKQQPYLVYKLQDVLISNYQLGGSSRTPVDSVALNFGGASMSYIDPTGSESEADCITGGERA